MAWKKQQKFYSIWKICDKKSAENSCLDSFPKHWKVIFQTFNFSFTLCSAGVEQRHTVVNAFNILVNGGFLRDQQGVQTLEVVQRFYEIINQPMPKANMHMKDLNLFCPPGKLTLDYQAVVTLVYENSQTNEKYYHAVRVSITLCRNLLTDYNSLVEWEKMWTPILK